jgi:protocatechuate 3,4-dioxygenase beta subunit
LRIEENDKSRRGIENHDNSHFLSHKGVLMNQPIWQPSRRVFLGSLAAGLGASAFFTVPGLFAEELARTPPMTEGPFYPDRLPLDTDSDLVIVNNSVTPAVGAITHLTGRVLDTNGTPLRDHVVEIWQVDNRGVYLHSADSTQRQRDTNFQGFGRATTNGQGEYRFRTIRPVPYPGRTPHIHVKVKRGDRELLTTQLFINGHPQNRLDGIFRELRDPVERELVLVDFNPIRESRIGELSARFDIVIGATPGEAPDNRKKKK